MKTLSSLFFAAACVATLSGCSEFGLGGTLVADKDGLDAKVSLNLKLLESGEVTATVDQFTNIALETGGSVYTTGNVELEAQLVGAVDELPAGADVVFVVDTTGSMLWAIESVKSAIVTVMEEQPQRRYGLVAYRDLGDTYVSRQLNDLTPNVALSTMAAESMEAGGGGDMPEHVAAGLLTALSEQPWGEGERHIVLIGDAPDHGHASPMPLADTLDLAASLDVQINSVVLACLLVCQDEITLWESEQ